MRILFSLTACWLWNVPTSECRPQSWEFCLCWNNQSTECSNGNASSARTQQTSAGKEVLFESIHQVSSLTKQPTFWLLLNDRRNSILMTWTTHIWVVLLIGRGARKICFNQSEALPRSLSDASSVWNFCTHSSYVISRESSGGVAKWRLFRPQASKSLTQAYYLLKETTDPQSKSIPLENNIYLLMQVFRLPIAQRKSSKLLLEMTSCPSAFLNSNFPPNKFIPRIANANMNRNSRPKRVITLVMVLITTSNWYRTGLTSLKMQRSLMLRNTDRAEFPLQISISQTLKFKRRRWRY